MTNYLVEMMPYNVATSSLVPAYFASGLVDSGELRTTNPYLLRLRPTFTHEVSVFDDNLPGTGRASTGSVTLNNTDGALDYLLDYVWGGKAITIKQGEPGQTYAQYTTIFVGSTVDILADKNDLTLVLRDNSWKVAKPLQPNVFTSGVPAGKFKPLCYGPVRNAKPVLFNAEKLIYQIHDGALNSGDYIRVYDQGVELLNYGSITSFALLNGNNLPPPGYFRWSLDGFIRLGAPAAGEVTFDAYIGGEQGYTTIGAMVRRILNIRGIADAELDVAAFTTLSSEVSSSFQGLYWEEPDIQLDEFLELICARFNLFWTFTRTGLLTIRKFKFRTPVATVIESQISGLGKAESPLPIYSVKIGYGRNSTVQEPGSFVYDDSDFNAYLSDDVIAMRDTATYPASIYNGKFVAVVGGVEVNSLKYATFEKLDAASWLTLNTDGTFVVTSPPGFGATCRLGCNIGVKRVIRTFTVLEPGFDFRLNADVRIFPIDQNNFPLSSYAWPVATGRVTFSFNTFGNTVTNANWTAIDSLGNTTAQGFSVIGGNTSGGYVSFTTVNPSVTGFTVKVWVTIGGVEYLFTKEVLIDRIDGSGTAIKYASQTADWPQIVGFGKPEDDATKGADWNTNVTGRTLHLIDGRIPLAINPDGTIGNGKVFGAALAAAIIDDTKFAAGFQPNKTGPSLPSPIGYTGPNLFFNETDKKLYRLDGVVWTSAVPAVDITGQLSNSQISALAANKITGALTSAQIADLAAAKITGTIVSTQIADDAITAPKILAGAVVTAKLAADAVVADKIAANAITSVKILAGSVLTDKLAAGSVTASKIVVAASGTAINDDPLFTDAAAWSTHEVWPGYPKATFNYNSSSGAINGTYAYGNFVTLKSRKFALKPGVKYRISAYVLNNGNGILYLRMNDKAGGHYTGIYDGGIPPIGSWYQIVAEMTADANYTEANLYALLNWGGSTGYMAISDFRIEEKVEASLIVDGTITGSKIAASTIVASNIAADQINTGHLQSGLITTDKLQANAVTSVKISAGQILATHIAASSVITASAQIADGIITNLKVGDIYSSNWSGPGGNGWYLNKSGPSYFNDVVISRNQKLAERAYHHPLVMANTSTHTWQMLGEGFIGVDGVSSGSWLDETGPLVANGGFTAPSSFNAFDTAPGANYLFVECEVANGVGYYTGICVIHYKVWGFNIYDADLTLNFYVYKVT